MYRSFDEIIERALALPKEFTIAVCAAEGELIHLAAEIQKIGLCKQILVGDKEKILSGCEKYNLCPESIEIIDEKDKAASCLEAVKLVKSKRAQVLVKGNVNTSDFLRAVLNKEFGLKAAKRLNVLSCYEVPGQKKLLFLADGGMITDPSLEDKVEILRNSIPVLHGIGIQKPKVALLSANENVMPGMRSTVDARDICEMAGEGKLPDAIYEGPISFDVAMRPEAAAIKGIESKISGDVDMFLVPNIETGNCLGKAMQYFVPGIMAGLVVGTTHPVIMASRSAPVKGKLTSISWAMLSYRANE